MSLQTLGRHRNVGECDSMIQYRASKAQPDKSNNLMSCKIVCKTMELGIVLGAKLSMASLDSKESIVFGFDVG